MKSQPQTENNFDFVSALSRLKAMSAARATNDENERQRRQEIQRTASQGEADWKEARGTMTKMLDEYEPPEQPPESDDDVVEVLRDKIASLKALVHERDDTITSQNDTIASLRDQVKIKNQPASLPFHKTLDEVADRIVKLRADLFHNPDTKKGASKFKVKLFVWLDSKDANAGNIKPLIFPLKYHPKTQKLTGGLVWKGAAYKQYEIKGTVHVPDHQCLVWRDECHVAIGGRQIELDEFEPAPAGLAVKRWYWNAG